MEDAVNGEKMAFNEKQTMTANWPSFCTLILSQLHRVIVLIIEVVEFSKPYNTPGITICSKRTP